MEKQEILALLKSEDREQEKLFELARQARTEHFGNKAFLRAVIEISNYCRGNCDCCGMRRDNKDLKRYRISPEEIIEIAEEIKDIGVHTVFLQGGEEPQTTEIAETVIPKIKQLGLTTILCLGNKTKEEYLRLANAGATKYILKHETSDVELHYALRHDSLQNRLRHLEWLIESGFKVGTGIIAGLPGQTIDSMAEDILLAEKYSVHMVSATPFIPNDQSPLKDKSVGDIALTLRIMATMRLVLPDSLIPTISALETLEPQGQLKGFNAGANVITINATPPNYRTLYPIYKSNRNIIDITHARSMVKKAGLVISEEGM